jgi:hypothetical protein
MGLPALMKIINWLRPQQLVVELNHPNRKEGKIVKFWGNPRPVVSSLNLVVKP